jgi:GNAT superfamily N-acetyltransferase
VVFEPLSAHHDRLGFDCGKPEMNRFLQQTAAQKARRDLGSTWVAVSESGSQEVLGYYTLTVVTLDASAFPTRNLPREVGCVLLARLAVAKGHSGQGLGETLLLRALLEVARVSESVGVYGLVLDALDDEAEAWYLRRDFGFIKLLDRPRHYFVPSATLRQLLRADPHTEGR